MATVVRQSKWTRTKEILVDSSWVTIIWDWFQNLLTRAVDAVLWVTMIFSCYQLIPGATQPPMQVSAFMFICQFVALDIGGIGLNKLAMQQGLERRSYPRIVAYILIGITLITVAFAGIQHAVPNIPQEITVSVEVMLVVARSIMIVLYGIAIHHLKQDVRNVREELDILRAERENQLQEVSTVRGQFARLQQTVDTLRGQLQSKEQEVSTLRGQVSSVQEQLSTEQQRVSTLQEQVDGGELQMSSLIKQLTCALVDVDTLRTQLDGKKQELAGLREILDSGQEWQQSRVEQIIESEQKRVSILQSQLDTKQQDLSTLHEQMDNLRLQLSTEQRKVSTLQQQLDSGELQVSTLRGHLAASEQTVDTLRGQLDSKQQVASTLCGQMDTQHVDSGHTETNTERHSKIVTLNTGNRKAAQLEIDLLPQARVLVKENPNISGRGIARALGCSPTTGSNLRNAVDREMGLAAAQG